MNLTRRGFRGAMLAAATAPAFVKADSLMRLAVPRGMTQTAGGLLIWGDGIHDDTAALKAYMRGERVVWASEPLSPFTGLMRGGTFRITSKLVLADGAQLIGGRIDSREIKEGPALYVPNDVKSGVLKDITLECGDKGIVRSWAYGNILSHSGTEHDDYDWDATKVEL